MNKLVTKELIEQYYIRENKSRKEIASLLNVSLSSVDKYFEKYNIPKVRKRRQSNFSSLVGEIFNHLTVISLAESTDTERRWICRCTCGNITNPIISYNLKKGYVKSCGCLKERGLENKEGYKRLYRGFEDLSASYWGSIMYGAKIRNLEFDITMEDAWNKYIKQDRKCALSGESIFIDSKYGTNSRRYSTEPRKQTASLDRIDSSKGYTVDNIQWVHKVVNYMKMDVSDESLIEWCKKIANYR